MVSPDRVRHLLNRMRGTQMQKLALCALFVGVVVAAGCGGDDHPMIKVDGSVQMGCDLFAQTGCGTNEKCTWLVDALTPQYVGHVGCAPIDPSPAAAGAPCMYGMPGTTGYDNCDKGLVCGAY